MVTEGRRRGRGTRRRDECLACERRPDLTFFDLVLEARALLSWSATVCRICSAISGLASATVAA